MRALITGISGFAGKHLAENLINKNYSVAGTYSTRPIQLADVDLYQCDIRNYQDVKKLIRDVPVDEIYHLAGPAFIPDSFINPRDAFNTIFDGTLNLLEALRELGSQAKLLYVGSGDIYGAISIENLPIDEGCLPLPQNPYATAKIAADLLCYQYNKLYGLKVVRARPFNHTGPGQVSNFVCSSFARQIVEIEKGLIKPIISVGNIEVARDFTDVRDVVEAYRLLLYHGQAGEAYNICSGQAIPIKSILEQLLALSVTDRIKISIEPSKIRPIDFPILFGNNTKLIKATNWVQQYYLKDTLQDLINYWRRCL